MKVSVLVPIYGAEKYIRQCAGSLFEQTYEDMEYIFVNDCTPDNSMDVLSATVARYPQRQNQVRIITHEHNRGVGAARITAFEAATGKYVMYADADDMMPADAAAILVEKIEAEQADIADGAFVYYTGEDSDFVCPPCHDNKNTYIRKMLLQNAVPHQLWARMFRRSTLIKHNVRFAEGINLAEDYSLMPRALFYSKRVMTDRVVYYYRIDREGMFTNTNKASRASIMSYLKANALIYRFFTTNVPGNRYSFALQTGLINAYAIGMSAGITYKEIADTCGYIPQSAFFRLCHIPLRHFRNPDAAHRIYQIVKRLYRLLVCREIKQGNSIHASLKKK